MKLLYYCYPGVKV